MNRDTTNPLDNDKANQPSVNALQPENKTGGDPDEYNRSVNAKFITDDPNDPRLNDLRASLENSY